MSKKNGKENLESTGSRIGDFLCERGEFSAPGATDEIWEDIIDRAIDDSACGDGKSGHASAGVESEPRKKQAGKTRTPRRQIHKIAFLTPQAGT